MAATVTKANMEQLIVELGPVPNLMGQLSDRLDRLEIQVRDMRESQIRTEESTSSTKERLMKMNGNMAESLKCGQENKEGLAVFKEATEQTFKALNDKVGDLTKGLWAIALIVLGYVIQTVLTKVL